MASERVLALRISGRPEPEEAVRLVRSALQAETDWGVLEIELFPGGDETLVLAHPARGTYIDRRAAAFLAGMLDRY